MAGELAIPPATLELVRGRLGRAREGLEETASSAPAAVDAGELTAMLTSIMARVLDSSATVSDSLSAVSAQVGATGAAFWEVDADIATVYAGTGPQR